MLQAILFDVDGTLIDSNSLHVEAWREAFRQIGKELSFDAIHRQMGKGGDQLVPVFCSPEEVRRHGKKLEQLHLEIFTRKYAPRARPFPRVRELFERVLADGYRIALASSAKDSELEEHLRKLGVADLIDAKTSSDDAEHSKPDPDIFEAALARLRDVRATDAIVIGDTPYDAVAAKRAGLKTIAVLSGGFGESELREAGAIEVYADVADLLACYHESLIGREAPRATR